ncbi:MAG: hypothetical protein SGPRY_013707, partial [Prymnesium sp.]
NREEIERQHTVQAEKRVPGAGAEAFVGRRKLKDAHSIEIGASANRALTARSILIATCAAPSVVDTPEKGHCFSVGSHPQA